MWARIGDGPILDRAAPSAARDPARWGDCAFRDPWVFRDPGVDGWRMVFTARDGRVTDPLAAGCIGLARSPDLSRSTLGDPIFTGGFRELEKPQILHVGDRRACLFCATVPSWSSAALARSGPPASDAHCLLAADLDGPLRHRPAPLLDKAPFPRRHAGRIVEQVDPKLMTVR